MPNKGYMPWLTKNAYSESFTGFSAYGIFAQ